MRMATRERSAGVTCSGSGCGRLREPQKGSKSILFRSDKAENGERERRGKQTVRTLRDPLTPLFSGRTRRGETASPAGEETAGRARIQVEGSRKGR